MGFSPISLPVHPLDVPWLTKKLAHYGCVQRIIEVLATPQELYLGGFAYNPRSRQLMKLPESPYIQLYPKDELCEFLDDWYKLTMKTLKEDKYV